MKIKERFPNFMSFPERTNEFLNENEFNAISWIAEKRQLELFLRFSKANNMLMLELKDGTFWAIGRFLDEIPDFLSTWNQTDALIEINERFLRELNILDSVRGILPPPDDFARQIIESSPSRPSDKKLQIFCNHCFENRGSGSVEYCYLDGYAVDENFLEGIVFKITINSKTNKLEVVPSARYDEKYLRNLNYEKYMNMVQDYVEKKWNEISFECSNCGGDTAVIEEV